MAKRFWRCPRCDARNYELPSGGLAPTCRSCGFTVDYVGRDPNGVPAGKTAVEIGIEDEDIPE